MRPNVLLIVLDTARADAFEPYGAGDGAGPAIGQLARAGGAVPTAIAPSNWTMPSHASLFTGVLPRTVGLARAPGGKRVNCRRVLEAGADRVMPEVFRRAGYATAGISANPWISKAAGFSTGFDRFVEVSGDRQTKMQDPRTRVRLSWMLEGARARVDDGAARAERLLGRWLDEEPARPFFWFVNLIECHSPYMPPRPYNDLNALGRARVADEARRHLTLVGIWRACVGGYDIPPDALARMRHLYGRSVRQMDDWLARVLGRMDERGVLDDTIVVVTSDHGENLGEARLIGHAFSLDHRLIRVPLVWAGPARLAVGDVVSLASLPRLLGEATGIEHPWGDDAQPSGVAVSQYDALMDPDDPRLERSIREWALDREGILRLTERSTAATDGRLKLVRHAGADRLYDLAADPFELTPMPGGNGADPGAVERLRRAVDRHHGPGPAVEAVEPAAADAESAELEERLRLLGYL